MASASKPRRKSLRRSYLDETPMQGPPSCKEANFRNPKLRRCPFNLGTVSWEDAKVLGCGMDGHVWRVRFGEDPASYAIKVFWDARDTENTAPFYLPVQRECQNNAILQMVMAAVEDSKAKSSPILIHPSPQSIDDAWTNLLAFSDERRGGGRSEAPGMMSVESIPRLVKCYGWLKFSGQEIRKMPKKVRPMPYTEDQPYRELSEDGRYLAIVYEYIEKGHNHPAHIEAALRFFWRVGFATEGTLRAPNWHQGVLLDYSDIVAPGFRGWYGAIYGERGRYAVKGL